jgi:hypothetical protein
MVKKRHLRGGGRVRIYVSGNATTINLSVGVGAPTPFQGLVAPAGIFTDIFTFTLAANEGSGYIVLDFPLAIPGVGTFNTLFDTMALVSNPDGILFNADDTVLETATGPTSSLDPRMRSVLDVRRSDAARDDVGVKKLSSPARFAGIFPRHRAIDRLT